MRDDLLITEPGSFWDGSVRRGMMRKINTSNASMIINCLEDNPDLKIRSIAIPAVMARQNAIDGNTYLVRLICDNIGNFAANLNIGTS